MPLTKAAIRVGAAACTLSICLIFLLSAWLDDATIVTSEFSDITEAKGSARRWIPEFVPNAARDLREAHSLATSARWGVFSLPPNSVYFPSNYDKNCAAPHGPGIPGHWPVGAKSCEALRAAGWSISYWKEPNQTEYIIAHHKNLGVGAYWSPIEVIP